jgi:hypothetical protein
MSESIRMEKSDTGISFSKSWKEGNFDYTTRVEKVDGGYIISEEKYGYESTDDKKEKYISECKKRVSTTNPLDENSDGKIDDGLFGFVNKAFLD